MIVEWRRITAAVTKVVFPLQKEKREDRKLGGERIYATCQTHTATGTEDNLFKIYFDWLPPCNKLKGQYRRDQQGMESEC